MANEALTNIALLYSMAAISGSGGGDTPTPRGSVSVTVGTVYTVGPNEQAKVINIGNEQNVVLDFYIPQGAPGDQNIHVGPESPCEYKEMHPENPAYDDCQNMI